MNQYVTGAIIRELREKTGLTQSELAEKLYVSDKAVSKWENGAAKPRSATLFRLSTVLEISADELLACRYQDAPTERKGLFAVKRQIRNNIRAAFYDRYGAAPPLARVERF